MHLKIRPIIEEDLPLLHSFMHLGVDGKHGERLMRQLSGKAEYLIAFVGDSPVGHILLKWYGTEDEPMASSLNGIPDVEDLLVLEEFRSLGIGSGLLSVAEGICLDKGYKGIGLGVGLDNPRAMALYSRRGYEPSGFGKYSEGGSYVDSEGVLRSWEEECIYMIKPLGGTAIL